MYEKPLWMLTLWKPAQNSVQNFLWKIVQILWCAGNVLCQRMLPVCHGVTLLVYLQGYYMKSIFTICTPNVSDLVQGEDPQLRSLMYHACVQKTEWYVVKISRQEAQLPLRKQGFSSVHSAHHNATLARLDFFCPYHASAWAGIVRVWCPSVRPSVQCDVDVRWWYRFIPRILLHD